ncbi:M56 family metallopeptidase [Anaerovorax odorimutans]|uniref:M56 family metallopeptidase n=1 Tax=Anaerovorax odorimutans TaxID=109327 RepID=UPI00040653AB|nr:M56 family metallopeptidase [Anaerovorax odorimutans]
MSSSIFSFIMSIFWLNIFICISTFMKRNTGFIINFSIMPLLLLMALCFFRLFCFFEIPLTVVINSESIFPSIISRITTPIFSILNNDISIIKIIVSIWIIGSFYCIKNYILNSIRLNKSTQAIQETQNPQILSTMNKILADSGENFNVKLIQSNTIKIPMVTGFFNPTIYLPDIIFTDTELKNILLHEWTHFLHKDAFIKLFMNLIVTIFWWNPFVHILRANLNHILEIRCDLRVTAGMNEKERIKYLKSIKKIIEYKLSFKDNISYSKVATASVLVSTNSMKKIEQRFLLVLNSHQRKKYSIITFFIYILLILSFLFSYMFVVQPIYNSTSRAGYEESFSITPQTSYLKINKDGTYALYVENKYKGDINQIKGQPLSSLPIKD